MNRTFHHRSAAFTSAMLLLAIAAGVPAMQSACVPMMAVPGKTSPEVQQTVKSAEARAQANEEVCTVALDPVLPACRCVRQSAVGSGSSLPPPLPRRPD